MRDHRNAAASGRISAIRRPVLLGFIGSVSNMTSKNGFPPWPVPACRTGTHF